ncbi:hypothetical protein BW33_02964 [Pseudomonas sp. RIT288]|nr:hypothetical protein BW33_02964 [Pseudomonas sp. RIT288]
MLISLTDALFLRKLPSSVIALPNQLQTLALKAGWGSSNSPMALAQIIRSSGVDLKVRFKVSMR